MIQSIPLINPKAQPGGLMPNSKPRILLFDIETTPNVSYTWGKWEQNVIRFKKQFEMLCFAWKWVGEGKTQVLGRDDTGGPSDKKVVKHLHKLINEADVVCGHNSDAFDIKKFKARAIFWGLPPLKRLATVDTKKIAKNRFAFNSNSLDDLGDYLGLGRKMKHEGFDLWLGCMANDPRAWKKMKAYNVQDVELLHRVYDKLAPWAENHPSMALLRGIKEGCPTCASTNVMKRGLRASHSGIQQQVVCKDCNSWFLVKFKKKKK